jgi:TolB-like protein/Tfp pilus assembly protein PilF
VPVLPVERKLAAILAADVVGYSRLMGQDEAGTLQRLRTHRRELIDPKIAEHKGRIVRMTGDGILIEFPSVVEAVACAVAVQRGMAERNATTAEEQRIVLRAGINLGDICVSRMVRDQVRDKLDIEFEDMGEQAFKNIARPLRVYRVRLATPETTPEVAPTVDPPVLALPDKPSLAVLPFQNMSGDPEQEYFVDGMVEDITTAIARLPWLFVIARNSSFAYKGKLPDLRQVARELGVRYVLEGSVRKAGNRVRITGQLIDTTTGVQIWADRIDGSLDDVFELQDQVASKVVGAIEPRLRLSEIERATRKPTESLDAYDLYLRAVAQTHKFTEESLREAVALAKNARAIDPSYAPAAALIAWCRMLQRGQSLGAVSDAEIVEAVVLARQAIEAGRDDPDVLSIAGYTIAVLAGEPSAALAAIDRALALNPNSAHAWGARGWVLGLQNQPIPAMVALQQAIRLSPLDPIGYFFSTGLAFAHLAAGRYEEAIEWADRTLHARPRHRVALRFKLVCLAHLGRTDDAREWLKHVLAVHPGLTIAAWKASYATATVFAPELLALYTDGPRKAGVPEE